MCIGMYSNAQLAHKSSMLQVRLLLLAGLASEHLLLLGPPGTAKSELSRRLSKLTSGKYYERLLTRFSVPEELFGPLSMRGNNPLSVLTWHNHSQWHLQSLHHSWQHVTMHASKSRSIHVVGLQCVGSWNAMWWQPSTQACRFDMRITHPAWPSGHAISQQLS